MCWSFVKAHSASLSAVRSSSESTMRLCSLSLVEKIRMLSSSEMRTSSIRSCPIARQQVGDNARILVENPVHKTTAPYN